jgi:hypothetical protein
MSDTDPYMAPEVEEANPSVELPEPEAAPEAVAAPVTEEISVPEGSVKTVLGWVGDDATRAQKALDAETKGENRSSLISKLEAIVN